VSNENKEQDLSTEQETAVAVESTPVEARRQGAPRHASHAGWQPGELAAACL
jgi:hypothetical protein